MKKITAFTFAAISLSFVGGCGEEHQPRGPVFAKKEVHAPTPVLAEINRCVMAEKEVVVLKNEINGYKLRIEKLTEDVSQSHDKISQLRAERDNLSESNDEYKKDVEKLLEELNLNAAYIERLEKKVSDFEKKHELLKNEPAPKQQPAPCLPRCRRNGFRIMNRCCDQIG